MNADVLEAFLAWWDSYPFTYDIALSNAERRAAKAAYEDAWQKGYDLGFEEGFGEAKHNG